MDGTIPTGQLPYVLRRIDEIVKAEGLGVANVFHAGDGNLHPLVMFDINKPGEMEKAERAGEEILKLCVEVGGCLTGEHGVGIEKRDLMVHQFGVADLQQQMRVRGCSIRLGSLTRPRCFRSRDGSRRDDVVATRTASSRER
jgi:glycolate oxidase